MKTPRRSRESERGQAVLLVVVAMGVVLLGALGFAIDGGQLFAQRRMAQAAADAAAQAGIMSMLNGTNTSGSHAFDAGSSFTCSSSDERTPCYFAQTLNGFGNSSDTVTVDFPTSVSGVSNGISFIRVTVQRTVPTTLMRLLGSSASTIAAAGIAAIVSTPTRAQIIVTSNLLPGAFTLSSGASLTISGGANRVIQVNSSDPAAVSASGGRVDLSLAGEAHTGADFGVWGGPRVNIDDLPFTLTAGAGAYVQPASPISDPLAGVTPPAPPPPSPPPTPVSPGTNGCPASVGPGAPCMLYSPGLYTSSINVANQTAVFAPGIYYMQGANFQSGIGGSMYMASGPSDPVTGAGMLVYTTAGGNINVGSNGTINLVGTPLGSTYRGLLFYSGPGGITLDTTGNLTLTGAVYSPSSTLNLQGSRSLAITGDIIANQLIVSGSPSIAFSGTATVYNTRQVALVK